MVDCSKIMGTVQRLLVLFEYHYWNLNLVTCTNFPLMSVPDPPNVFEMKELANALNVFLAHLPDLWAWNQILALTSQNI